MKSKQAYRAGASIWSIVLVLALWIGSVSCAWAQSATPRPTSIGDVTPPPEPTPTPTAIGAPTATATATPRPIIVGLSLRASSPLLTEGNAITVVGTLSRPVDTSGSVSISSDELSQASVSGEGRLRFPSRIEIAASQTRFSFLIYADEDDFFWSLPRLRLTLSYNAYAYGINANGRAILPLAVRDNDRPRVMLRLNGSAWREGSTDERRLWAASNVRPLGVEISLSSNDPAILLGASTVHEASYLRGFVSAAVSVAPGSQAPRQATITARAVGCDPASALVSILGQDAPALRLQLAPSTVDEDNAAGTLATVTREGDLSQPLTVTARSDDLRVARVSANSVTIGSGQSSAVFRVLPLFAREFEEDQEQALQERDAVPTRRPLQAQVSVDALGLVSARATLSLRNATPLMEAVASPEVFVEGQAPRSGVLTLRLLRPRFFDVPVDLSTNNSRLVFSNPRPTVPGSGAPLRVPFTILDNDALDGFEQAAIQVGSEFTRLSPSGQGASTEISIQDDESPLSLSVFPKRVTPENPGFVLSVLRGQAASTALRVLLAASPELGERLSLPSAVVIPAGQREVRVRGSFVRASEVGTRFLSIQAQTPGNGANDSAVLEAGRTYTLLNLLSVDLLSPSSPRGLAVFEVPGFGWGRAVAPTRLQVSVDNADVAVPSSILIQPGQKILLLPLLLRPNAGAGTGRQSGVAKVILSPAFIIRHATLTSDVPVSYEVAAVFSPARLSTSSVELVPPTEGVGTRVRLKFSLPLLRASVISASGAFVGRISLPRRGLEAQASGTLEDGGQTLVLALDETLGHGEPVQITLAARDAQGRSLESRQLLLTAP